MERPRVIYSIVWKKYSVVNDLSASLSDPVNRGVGHSKAVGATISGIVAPG